MNIMRNVFTTYTYVSCLILKETKKLRNNFVGYCTFGEPLYGRVIVPFLPTSLYSKRHYESKGKNNGPDI